MFNENKNNPSNGVIYPKFYKCYLIRTIFKFYAIYCFPLVIKQDRFKYFGLWMFLWLCSELANSGGDRRSPLLGKIRGCELHSSFQDIQERIENKRHPWQQPRVIRKLGEIIQQINHNKDTSKCWEFTRRS